jgi:hypothetical protein
LYLCFPLFFGYFAMFMIGLPFSRCTRSSCWRLVGIGLLFLVLGLSPLLQAKPVVPGFAQLRYYHVPGVIAEHGLNRLEVGRFYRSVPLLTPGLDGYVYAEVSFLPDERQTVSQVYYVPLPRLTPVADAELVGAPCGVVQRQWESWLNPGHQQQRRRLVSEVGYLKRNNHGFETLTPVDWNMTGDKLLMRGRSGVLYTGLRTSDLLVWDVDSGMTSVYPELVQAVQHYWRSDRLLQHGLPEGVFERYSIDLEPVAWQLGSSTVFYWRAWAYSTMPSVERVSLGLWTYNTQTQQPSFLYANGRVLPQQAQANGWQLTFKQPCQSRIESPTGSGLGLANTAERRWPPLRLTPTVKPLPNKPPWAFGRES